MLVTKKVITAPAIITSGKMFPRLNELAPALIAFHAPLAVPTVLQAAIVVLYVKQHLSRESALTVAALQTAADSQSLTVVFHVPVAHMSDDDVVATLCNMMPPIATMMTTAIALMTADVCPFIYFHLLVLVPYGLLFLPGA